MPDPPALTAEQLRGVLRDILVHAEPMSRLERRRFSKNAYPYVQHAFQTIATLARYGLGEPDQSGGPDA